MDNQSGIKVFLDKLKIQIAALQDILFPSKKATLGSLRRVDKQVVAESHPGMVLEIGNELLITEDIVKVYRGLVNSRGRVVIIDQLPTPPDESIKASAFGIQVYVNTINAQHMRAAYLRREQVAT